MVLNPRDINRAKAASKIYYAISLLHEEITKWMGSGMHKRDFAKSLQFILQSIEKRPGCLDEATIESLRENIKRACSIRHRNSHQCFDIKRFKDDIECLKNIAKFIGAHDVVHEIEENI